MTRADGNHDLAGLRHSLLDPLAPIGIALENQIALKFRRAGKILIEAIRDPFDVALRPRSEHSSELDLHGVGILERSLEQSLLGAFRKRIEEAQLLADG